ncbi:U3 small nucleolar RNA-associated protein 25 [Impatiens glandulifera]|uniref:U3 small nucleolar RNA-associated protein 25 n=1 Tax=Impatiens glandulifera TaxID=253017 RepID=UPI001FB191C7|nr:U3 small nucleolar RNA-associated protein 25 [Impatiens glandulifera]
MSKTRFAKSRGFKRKNTSDSSKPSRNVKKARGAKFEDERRFSDNSDSGESSDEQQEAVSSEEEEEKPIETYKEPTMYDNLLKTLGSSSKSLADVYKQRQREQEGQSDLEETSGSESDLEEASGSESDYSTASEEDVEEGKDEEPRSSGISKHQAQKQKSATVGVTQKNEDIEDDDDEQYESDDAQDTETNDLPSGDSLAITSSFVNHLGHTLSTEEVENLSQRKWKYTWETSSSNPSNSKWMGTGACFIKDDMMNLSYSIKPRLQKHWLDNYKGGDFDSSKQKFFFSLCNSYKDILYHNKKPFYLKGLEEDSNIMTGYVVHTLNHVLSTGDVVVKNDARLAKLEESNKDTISEGDALDHGFTRPKVLILLPLASIALKVVKKLIELTPPKHKVNVEYKDRFFDDFGTGVEDDEVENKKPNPSKPVDFETLFGGNNNDHFVVGIKYTRRSIKLFADFYSCDIIIASPLGLITKIGEAESDKEKDVDYLSSIEVLVIDHSDVIAMQNWSHVNTVVEHLNCLPSKQHGTNIMRIRPWYFDGHARFYRQTIILGSYLNPDMNALFNHHCFNYQGKVKSVCEYKGVLPKVLIEVRQIYERFDAETLADADDARLEYFTNKVLPKIINTTEGGVMLFISSYFEFVRLRNYLKSQEASICLLGDYTKQSDISRARIWFYQGTRKIMLYTERSHFYHRYKIRGMKNLIIYSLPERNDFYPEIVNMLEDSHNMSTTVLFSRFDQLKLERIVGSGSAKRMLKSDKSVFAFC